MLDDLLGTPQLATDSSQNLAWQATYTPFGQASVSGTLTQNLRLPGQYFDSEGGWNHNGFRNYIPDLGRYAESDPLGLLGSGITYDPSTGLLISQNLIRFGTNTYAYVNNNPINLIDVLGLSPCKNKVPLIRAMKPEPPYLRATTRRGEELHK